jgi:TolB-like protein
MAMTTRFLRSTPAVLLVAAAASVAGCATGGARDPNAAVANLEAARQRNPRANAALRALGIAYYTAQRFPEARAVLDTARSKDPNDGLSALYAGLAAEAQEDWTTAKASYATYLAVGKSKKAREQIQQRMAFVSKQELAQAAKAALQAESQIGASAGDPKTVAVPPFRFSGADSTLRPLERGLADLLITDLAQAPSLTLVERDRMQAVVDEIALSQGNRVDEATAVRAGRLLRAGRIVQGGLTQVNAQALQMNAAVLDVGNARAVGGGSADDQLEQLFEAEKRLALQVLQALGVDLTPEQRAAIDARPTKSFAAFLAYSQGLVADDRGDFSTAALLFGEAGRLDPGFRQAGARASQASAAAAGGQVSVNSVEAALSAATEGSVVSGAKNGEVITGTQPPAASAIPTINAINTTTTQGTTSNTDPSTLGGAGSAAGGPTSPAPPNNPIVNPPATQTGRVVITIPRP